MSAEQAYEQVLVYCASSTRCDPAYHAEARRLGVCLARAGITVLYGGGAVGSMQALADGALSAGGHVVGIQPHFMNELEWTHPEIPELHLVESMGERKRMMLEKADAVVALPGGTGTFDELFDALTAKRLGLFPKPIVIVNQRGFFDAAVALLEHSVREGFMDDRHLEMWSVVDRADQVVEAIRSAEAWPTDSLDFAAL